MLRSRMSSWVGLGLLGFGAALCAGSLPSPPFPDNPAASRALDLPPETLVRQELRQGESHEYRLPLAPGEVVDVLVEQDGVDVSLSLSGPDGEALLSIDTPIGDRGGERLVALSETGGMYRLRIQAGSTRTSVPRGSYGLRLTRPRPAGPRDRLRARAWREYSQGEALRRVGSDAARSQALVHYGHALRLWAALNDREPQAISLYRRAAILRDRDLPGAVETYERALHLVENPSLRVSILNLLTIFLTRMGDTQRAFETGEQALELAQQTGDPSLQAAAVNNLGMIYRSWGETEKSLEYFDEAVRRWSALGASSELAKTIANRAEVLLAVGHPKPVLGMAKESLRVLEEAGDPGGVGDAYRLLGVAFDQLGAPHIALVHLEMAREQARNAGNRWAEGLALNEKGSTLLNMGALDEAHAAFSEARRIARESGNRGNEAFAYSGLGNVLLEQGDAAGALELFASSERLYRLLGDPNALARVLYSRALAERSLGRIEASLASIEHALTLVEELRKDVVQRDLRLHVIGARADFYDLKVDLWLRLHEQRKDQGLEAQAFAASEWRRARSLLETMERMGAGPPHDLSEESLRRQTDLRVRLQRLAQEKLKAVSGMQARGPRGLSEIEREIQGALVQWEKLSEEMRQQSSVYAAVTAPKLVGVREVQDLLEPDTALVAYTVGEERTILWWIEKDLMEVHQDLPPRAKLKALADDTYDLLSRPSQTRQREMAQRALAQLGTSLLGPVTERLGRIRRVAVVADDTLQSLPFAVLPVPGSGEPLVESHAVVQLPSASLVAALRSRQKGRATPTQVMAVFGDPVFDASDPRVRQERGASGNVPPGGLSRLPASSREVKAILELVPAARSRRFIGFEATRTAAMDRDLAHYRYIHFATHGFVDPDNPNLSGIQLSRFNPQGELLAGEGLLPFYEVYNLSFPADLVTLSACRTADGPRVRGEGPLGMSRSFLYAGASRVLGTLWNVDDSDAANLMTHFYRALLRDGKSPALALQEAQKAMRARDKTRAPYHWAGYVLQGDWR